MQPRKILIAAGALALLIGVTIEASSSALASPKSAKPTATTDRSPLVVDLVARTTSHRQVDLGAHGFSVADQEVDTDALTQNGQKSGTAATVCQVVDLTPKAVAFQCVSTFDLPRGQVSVQGLIRASVTSGPKPHTQAITGGTGRFRDAEGVAILTPSGNTFHIRLIIDGT